MVVKSTEQCGLETIRQEKSSWLYLPKCVYNCPSQVYHFVVLILEASLENRTRKYTLGGFNMLCFNLSSELILILILQTENLGTKVNTHKL